MESAAVAASNNTSNSSTRNKNCTAVAAREAPAAQFLGSVSCSSNNRSNYSRSGIRGNDINSTRNTNRNTNSRNQQMKQLQPQQRRQQQDEKKEGSNNNGEIVDIMVGSGEKAAFFLHETAAY